MPGPNDPDELVTGPEDVVTLAEGPAGDPAAGLVRYGEVTVTSIGHLDVGIDPGGLSEGRTRARAAYSVEIGWVFDAAGEPGVEVA